MSEKKVDRYGFTESKSNQKKIHDGMLYGNRIADAFERSRFNGFGKDRLDQDGIQNYPRTLYQLCRLCCLLPPESYKVRRESGLSN
jgi:hypothetical protein